MALTTLQGLEPMSDAKSGIDRLGALEEALLVAVYRLGEDKSYGVALHKELQRRLGKTISIGALYVTLNRLAAKGYVSSRKQAGSHGRIRRCYTIQPSGVHALNDSRVTTQKLWDGLCSPLSVRT